MLTSGDVVQNRVTDTIYQVGKTIFRKAKIIEVNPSLVAFIEFYNYNNGRRYLFDYLTIKREENMWVQQNQILYPRKKFK